MSLELPQYDNPPMEERVRGLLCADEKGRVQIIAPEAALVDPEPIRSTTARPLISLPPEESAPISAIPGFYGMPSVVHSDLKMRKTLALATDEPGRYVRASGAELETLCGNHVSYSAAFCEALVPTPKTTEDDRKHIERCVETFTSRRIEARLDDTLHVPPLPEAARRIIALSRQEEFDLKELVQIVETDPSIAARILGWANSALYATATPSKTLHDAIMRVLGADVVFNMALGLAIGQTLKLPESHVAGLAPYWLDAVFTAATMESLAHHISPAQRPEPGTAYLAGLLSNFGTLVIGHVFPPQYEHICRMQEANPQIPHDHIDQHVLSLNREVIAATLLEQWELPDEVVTPVRFQFVTDYTGEHQTYVDLLRFTKALLKANNIPYREDMAPEPLNAAQLEDAERLGIDPDGLDRVIETLTGSRQDLGELAAGLAH